MQYKGNLASRKISSRARSGFLFWSFLLLCIFNLALPKAGIKANGLPLTWGYALLSVMAVIAAFSLPFSRGPRGLPVIQAVFGFIPLGICAILKAGLPGGSVTSAFIWSVNLIFLPVVILILLGRFLENITEDQMAVIFSNCLRLAVAWGLFNFFLYVFTRHNIEIPYVTVNADDNGLFQKNNRRGGFMKLVSTYNNGNIFGACALLLGPLYFYFERHNYWRFLYIGAIILTLSRTAWFGACAMFLILRIFNLIKFNRVSIWLAVGCGLLMIITMMSQMGWGGDRLADSTIGGRLDADDAFGNFDLSLFGTPQIRIPELTYLGIVSSFGIIGLCFSFVALFLPFVYAYINRSRLSRIRRAAAAGVMTYATLAIIDGAFAFPPVIALFLFVSAMVYRRDAPLKTVPR